MLALWILSYLGVLYLGLFLGYKYNKIQKLVADIQEQLKVKQGKKIDEKKAEIIDPYDVVYQAKVEHDRVMRDLNR